MKAVRITQTGGAECLHEEEIPEPTIRPDEVLVQVVAASINPVDTKIRAGKFKRFHPVLPAILGRDVSGTIARVGSVVSRFSVGDAVFGMLDYDRGTYAQFAVASAREITARPWGLGADAAAGIPVAALTAWQSLFEHGKLRRGQRVLVHGAGGGVGHFAVQFAVWCGAEVAATCSAEDLDFVRSLGAAKVLDYKKERFEETLIDLDLVLDLVSGETRQRSWQTLRAGGILISTLPDPEPPDSSDVSGREVVVYPAVDQLSTIASLVADDKIRVHIDRVFPLAEAAAAHRHIEEEHSRGKTLLHIA